MNLKRRNIFRPNQTFIVSELLNNHAHNSRNSNTITSHISILFLAISIRKYQFHFFRLLRTKIKDIANFGSFHLFQLTTIDAELLNCLVQNFLINSDIFTTMQIDIILTSIANRLKLMAKLRKSATRSKRHIRFITNSKSVITTLIRLNDRIVIIIQTLFAIVNRIHILHHKFTTTHNSTLSAKFVSQFVLELINANWQIFVAL